MRLVSLCLFLALTGCVTPTEPVSVGEGRYMIGVNARGGFQSNSELTAQTIRRANEFCHAQGKIAEVESSNSSGVQGWTPQDSQVVFRCVEPST